MGWKESSVMHERGRFILEAMGENANISELCRLYGVSRKTGYKWLHRYRHEGPAGLMDRSRRPVNSPLAVPAHIVAEVVRLRQGHPTWGPKKLQALLLRRLPATEVPSQSTIARVLTRCGLVTPRHPRQRRWHPGNGPIEASAPNHLWTVDFKGWWRTGDGRRCEPLTIRDAYSRYILEICAMESTCSQEVKELFDRVFERYGLPEAIRSDNGPPFACTRAPAGLSRLSAWWRALGVALDRIQPGHPEQNGAHERMHRDMRQELQPVRARNKGHQQELFDLWRVEYNTERPHEALGMKTPSQLYTPSSRMYTGEEPQPVYPEPLETRQVKHTGEISIAGQLHYLSESLAGWPVGLESIDRQTVRLWFVDLCLGDMKTTNRAPLKPPENTAPKPELLPMS
jgi:putative transposase